MSAINISPFYLLLIAAAVLLGILSVWLVARARKPARTGGVVPGAAVGGGGWAARMRAVTGAVAEAIHFLTHRREWRYQVPWLLLLGEPGSGKTSIAASAGSARRELLSGDEEALALPGTRWWFFERGVLIDLERAAVPGGRTLEERAAWGTVVRGLFDHRPERPIDGVVMTLSARSLSGSAADLQRIAEENYARLVELQRRFEFTFPVYVVVTQCDVVEGFDIFWGLQSADQRRAMVGWSNPYSLDSGYLPGWVDEAFDAMGVSLRRLQLQGAAGACAAEEVDRYFLFPQRMRQLAAPIAVVLDGILRPSAYHANFFLRGIYFSGAVGGEGGQLPRPRNDVAFLDALLDEKVFAESNLARVTRQGTLSRHQVLRRLQLGIVTGFALLCTWLAFAGYDLNRQVDGTAVALQMVKSSRLEQQCAGREQVYALLDQLSAVDLDFTYAPIPASWFDRRHAKQTSMSIADTAFERVVFPSLRCHLEMKARELVQPGSEGATTPGSETSPENGVVGRAQALLAFERHRELYEGLTVASTEQQGRELLARLAALAEYLYGAPLPLSVMERKGVHLGALARVQYSEPLELPENMRAKAADALMREAAQERAALERRLVQGGDYLQAIDDERLPYLASVTGLVAWMRWVQTDWLGAGEGADPCAVLERSLRPISAQLHQYYHYPVQVSQVAEGFSAGRCLASAIDRLEGLNVPRHGPLFLRGPKGLAPAPAFAAELAHLESLAGTAFMQQTPQEGFVCRNPLRGWDTERLARANTVLREFEEWMARGAEAGDDSRSLAERVARRQIEALAADLLSGAQVPQGLSDGGDLAVTPAGTLEQGVRQQSTDFARAVDPLVMTIQLLRQRGFEAAATRVSQCARDFSSDALRSIDSLANASRLYAPGFAGERGGEPDMLLLASLGTDAETKDYLKRQLQRGQVLAGYAAPFVSFLMNTDGVDDARLGNREAVVYWNNTIGELNRYVQFREPNGQVAQLDELFLKQLAGLTLGNCGEQLAAYRPPAHGNDLFSAHRASLEKEAGARCAARREGAVAAGYQTLAREFNQTLAGRFPFGPDTGREAPPLVVKKFLLDYGERRESLRKEVAALKGERWREVDLFLDRLDAAARFFAGNLTAGEVSQPVQVKVGFRAYPEQSPGSEQIVQWRFRSGTEVAAYPNANRDLEWQAGRPVSLELVWAEQSLMVPVHERIQAQLRVDRSTAVFGAEGSWSLLRLLHGHAPRHLSREVGLDPTVRVLEFDVPIARKGVRQERQRSRMYLTLQLLGADPQGGKAVPLRVPEPFPDYAPTAW